QPGELDAAALGGALGVTASAKDGAVWLELPRPPAARPSSAAAPAAPLLRASFSGSDLRAALRGTFVLSAQAVGPGVGALRPANVHLVGLVPQDTQGDAGWLELHFRGKNNSVALVRGLLQALQARAAQP